MENAHDQRSRVIGISGGSASGKSTFTGMLTSLLEELAPVVIAQDTYFHSHRPGGADHPGAKTHNRPEAVDWEALIDDLDRLREQARLVIVEGHLLFTCEALRERLDLAVYLDADPHERVLRRIERTVRTGSATVEDAIAWYRKDVVPNYHEFTLPSRRYADLIVPMDGSSERALAVVAAGVRAL